MHRESISISLGVVGTLELHGDAAGSSSRVHFALANGLVEALTRALGSIVHVAPPIGALVHQRSAYAPVPNYVATRVPAMRRAFGLGVVLLALLGALASLVFRR